VFSRTNPYRQLERRIGRRFRRRELLERALTHRSYANEKETGSNYERLEFLGDSILGFVVAEWLFHKFPDLTEGKLSRMRANVVRKATLANVGRELGIGELLLLGEGELKSGGFERDSILADSLEAIIGAIYLDGGLSNSKDFVLHMLSHHLQALRSDTAYKDPKTRLQEYLQQRGISVPNYVIIDVSGEPHRQLFQVQCKIEGVSGVFTAKGKSRRSAEQIAAEKAYAALIQQ